MTPDQHADRDQADLMAALLNAMYEAPAYKPPVEPQPSATPRWEDVPVPEPARTVPAQAAQPAATDWERIIPRIAIGTGAVLATAEGAIIALNWRMFLHILEGIGAAVAILVLLAVFRTGTESVTVTGRGLKVWRS